jgi:LysM repeat protein
MQIWIKQGKGKLRLPVLPPNFEEVLVQQNTTVNINSFGKINLIGKRGLKTLSLSCFFPNHKYGFVQYKGFPKPYACVKLIESWMGKPVRVTITGTDINGEYAIESFNHSEQDGTGDVYYTIELKEYRRPSLKTKKKKTMSKKDTKIQKPSTKRATKSAKTITYTIKKGDTLSGIAKRKTGDMANVYAIANQNGIKNVNLIFAGQKLVIKT